MTYDALPRAERPAADPFVRPWAFLADAARPVDPGRFERATVEDNEILINGAPFPCRAEFAHLADAFGNRQAARLRFTILDPEAPHEALASANGCLNVPGPTDGPGPSRHWNLFSQKVVPNGRRGGLGTALFQGYEALVRALARSGPRLAAESLCVNTGLMSLTRLLVSQAWLEENGLAPWMKGPGRPDLGYLPTADPNTGFFRPSEEEIRAGVADVLRARVSELEERRNGQDIWLEKRLGSAPAGDGFAPRRGMR